MSAKELRVADSNTNIENLVHSPFYPADVRMGEPITASLRDAHNKWINAGWYGAIGWVDSAHTMPIVRQIKAARPDLMIEIR